MKPPRKNSPSFLRIAGVAAAAGWTFSSPAPAAGPRFTAPRISVPPVIDGDLSDDAWKSEPIATGFTRLAGAATEQTRVRTTVDDQAIYFAFDCADAQVSRINAQQKKRNGSMGDDDRIVVGIDPRGDRRDLYWFEVNAAGTQSEEIPGGAASKIEWRGDWNAAARIGGAGWTAEVAVPFSILRYPAGQREFGLIFRRIIPRINEESAWPPGTDYHSRENQAYLTELTLPRQRVVPRYMPYTLVGAGGSLKNSAGIDIKYTAPNNVTGLVAVKPDFQTIEDVIQTVDFSYNPRFLEDRRPFFTEGGDRFGDRMMFYSRNVGEIDTGAKLFGKVGRVGFGVMDAVRFGNRNTLLANAGYDLSAHSDVGVALLHHTGDADSRVMKLSANWGKPMRFYGLYMGASIYRAAGEGRRSSAATAYINRWNGEGRLGWHVFYNRIPKDYRPGLAFVWENDKESIDGWLDVGKDYKKGPLLNLYTETGYSYARHLDGRLFYKGFSPGIGANFRKNWNLHLGADIIDRPPHRDRVANLDLTLRNTDLYRATRLSLRHGRQNGGDYLFAALGQGFKLSDRFSMSLSLERLSLDYNDHREDEKITQGVVAGVYDITPERGIVFRLVGSGDGFNAYTAYRQELRRGKDIFLILGDPNVAKLRARIGLKIVNTY